ncbi:hypothetical protein S40285_02953 [Stachybotrys chlorohalonatus IBT 40285]|uniref:Uncharacterized protein n=1 Tax=Stachybotrys chlorohalonatus (strain IBT 40285) TaxID=1283841 RepID=A0A084QK66_STAC4|nr:hypothetical protein S40285_02953 [Stachybotrys chlorohalonata IBT 40285]
MAFSSKRRFSLSPAVKASRRVMNGPEQPALRGSVDSTASASSLGDMPVVDVERHLVDPAFRWSTANRI